VVATTLNDWEVSKSNSIEIKTQSVFQGVICFLTKRLFAMAQGTQWDRSSVGRSDNRIIELRVHCDQVADGPYLVTYLSIGIVSLKERKFLFWWPPATADRITLAGAFSGPRSPRDQSGGYGYIHPNPFEINYSSSIQHFIDYSPIGDPPYSMDHATYTVNAYFGNSVLSTTVSW
jgi:hypothetical protein